MSEDGSTPVGGKIYLKKRGMDGHECYWKPPRDLLWIGNKSTEATPDEDLLVWISPFTFKSERFSVFVNGL